MPGSTHDPCADEKAAIVGIDAEIDDVNGQFTDDMPPATRHKLEQVLRRLKGRRHQLRAALDECRRVNQPPG